MDTRPLSLRYRPVTFSDLVGNDMIRTILVNSVKENKVRTAYFLVGGRGSGKTSAARIFAKAINCINPQGGEPCNECESCKAITDGKALDVIEIDAASENSVQSIRSLASSLQYSPVNSKRKVVILDEVHCLTVQASNALLKTLEEPPAHVVFIFCTTDPQKVLETIKSRTMMFSFQRLSNQQIIGRLKHICEKENFEYEESALKDIAVAARGGMRDAVTTLDQCSILSDNINSDIVNQVLGGIPDDTIADFLLHLEDQETALPILLDMSSKNSSTIVINSIFAFLCNVVQQQSNVKLTTLSADTQEHLRMLSTNFTLLQLSQLSGACLKTQADLTKNTMFDTTLYLIDLYLTFFCIATHQVRTEQTEASLLDIYHGIGNKTTKSADAILAEFFTFKKFKGKIKIPDVAIQTL